ncbi:MAG: nicotinate (nicotinamide) nucleotide adenylyltransferase [Sphaerochaetaceae bacterium]|nr:nicotinate (nicotinamide) nucleotide adenylyltransferase [Sphaerochaetaceae bacterium]
MNKTAMLGGSFDPIHLGHLFLLHCAVSLSDYKKFIIVPAKQSNFKRTAGPAASDADRLEMIRLALEDYKDLYPEDSEAEIVVSDMEIKRGGISYTYDTVMEIRAKEGLEGRLGLVMGDDHVTKLDQWYRYSDLKDLVEFLICRRNPDGALWSTLPSDAKVFRLEPASVSPESATDIRENLRENEAFLSRRVLEYVRKHNLYS